MSIDCEVDAIFASTKAHELATCHRPQVSEAAPEEITSFALELLEMVLLEELMAQAALFTHLEDTGVLLHSARSAQGNRSIAMAALPPSASLNKAHGIRNPTRKDSWWQRGGVSSVLHRQTSWSAAKFLCLAGLGSKQRRQRKLEKLLARKVLVLPSSEFEHLFEKGPTEKAYASTPVCDLRQYEQGRTCQQWAKGVLQKQNPQAEISDPDLGTCCNGSKRGVNRAEYDFLMGGRRVEIKSSRMAWSTTEGGWRVLFSRIKLPYGERTQPAFDDLYLVLLSPKGMHLIKHDLVTRISTCGERTGVSGHQIRVDGSRRTNCWEGARDEILEKLCQRGGCSMVHQEHLSDLGFQEILSERVSPGQAAVAGIPMSSVGRERRGNRIQEIGLALDRMLNPQSAFSFTGGKRGTSSARADWVRGSVRVELKSFVLTFDRSNNRWQCRFFCIKPDLFDELWLAIYTSVGIHYYRSKYGNRCSLGFVKAGVATKINGHQLNFYGSRGELDPLEAFKAIEAKIFSRGCELIAIVEWEKGASMRDGSRTVHSV